MINTKKKGPSQDQINKLMEPYKKSNFHSLEKLTLAFTKKYSRYQLGWNALGIAQQRLAY